MQKEKYLIIPNKKELKLYEKYNFNTFILPLEDYSIGFDVYFNIDEINELAGKYEIYVIMNKFLHRNIYKFKELYSKFNKSIKFIIEDIGLVNIIDKDRLVLYENHILSNYVAINYLGGLGFKNVVINNDLTIDEIKEIMKKVNSNIFYFYVSHNHLMYSRRNLVTNYNKYFNMNDVKEYKIKEEVSHEVLNIKEEKDGSIVTFKKIFCASKYLDELKGINLIINFSGIDSINEKMILENYNKKELCNLIDSDYYFLENDIKYKVGDLK
jgi:hypothetical protein